MRPLHSRIRFVTPPADRCTTLWAFGPLDWETTIADVKWMAVNTDIPVLDVSVIVHRNLDRKVLVLTPVDPWYSFALAMAANTAKKAPIESGHESPIASRGTALARAWP